MSSPSAGLPSAEPVARFKLVRILLALAVALSHAVSITTGRYEDEPLLSTLGLSLGNLAVIAFFSISGYLVAGSLNRNGDLLAFGLRRAFRIWPGLVLSTLLTVLVIGPAATSLPWDDYWRAPDLGGFVLGNIALVGANQPLPGLFLDLPDQAKVNVPLWTLKYEVAAYCLLGAGSVLFGRQRVVRSPLLPALALLAALSLLSAAAWLPHAPAAVGHAGLLFSAFVLGVLLFTLRARRAGFPLAWALFAMLAALLHGTGLAHAALVLAVGVGAVAVGLSRLPGLGAGERLGDCSYGLYVLAFPLTQCARQILGDAHPLAVFALGTALALPLAAMSWTCVERPAISLGRRLSARFASARREIADGPPSPDVVAARPG